MDTNEGNLFMGCLYILISRTGLCRSSTGVRRYHQVTVAMFLCLAALPHAGHTQQPSQPVPPAAQLPSAPAPQPPSQTAPIPPPEALPGTLSGTVTDSDGDVVVGAHISLLSNGQNSPAGVSPNTAISSDDGEFIFLNVPSGPFSLSIAADGFVPQQTSGVLHSGESYDLPAIVLISGFNTSVQVTASQTDIAQAQIGEEEKQRVLGVFPNFYVSYIPNPVPLDPRQKVQLAFKTLIDPVNFVLIGGGAGIEQAENTYAWGDGAQGYGKRYAGAFGTFLTGDILGNAVLPILFKQDPRYFYKGTGSTYSRIFYAIANAVVCKGDNHHWQFDYSAVLGGLAASGISNSYYPAPNRTGAALIFESAAIGTGISAVSNIFQEFLVHKLTPHIPHNPPVTPKP
jgi:hypothetical protein